MNHHHQCHCHPTPSPSATTTCHCTICYTTTHHPPPDPLIHSISSHQHHHHIPPQIPQYAPPQNHHYAPPQNHHDYYPPPPPPQTHQNHPQHAQENPPQPPPNPTISSLIHRISALESSLRRRKHSAPPSSLRDAAARTIQTHFRAFLVRRSATLRHLKDLASIKSALNRLKSSVSNNPQFDSRIVSRQSRSLLIKLDSIQGGGDPMIRDGKRAISRELIRFMELIDEMSVERQVITVKNVRFGKNSKKSGSRVLGFNEREFLESLKICGKNVDEMFDVEIPGKDGVSRIRIGDLSKSQSKSQPKVKKNVRFDEDGNVYRLFKSNHKQVSSDEEEVEVEEIGVSSKETEVEEDDSSTMSENEMDPRKNLRTRIHHTNKKNQPDEEDKDDNEEDEEDDAFVFSAPLPAKMEY